MTDCATHGHLFGADDRCLHCGDPAPQIPEFLRGAREPDGRDAEIERLRAEITALTAMKQRVGSIALFLWSRNQYLVVNNQAETVSAKDETLQEKLEEILREAGP